jgi:hypothetical protein
MHEKMPGYKEWFCAPMFYHHILDTLKQEGWKPPGDQMLGRGDPEAQEGSKDTVKRGNKNIWCGGWGTMKETGTVWNSSKMDSKKTHLKTHEWQHTE